MNEKFKPKLEINKYEGLITIFAIILAVEYSSDAYDLWDGFLGLLVIYIGFFKYWEEAKKEKDFLHSILTTNLIGLGILNTVNTLVSFGEKESFFGSNIDFGIFIFTSLILYVFLNKAYNKNEETNNLP